MAPLKTVTIPKLELSSAVLLSKLLSTVCKELGIKPCKMFAWCDSTVALNWISTSPHKLKTIVANRVISITEKVPATQWRHVSSADNPADIGSRGCTFKNLVDSVLWWNGPSWLLLSPDQWPAFHSQNFQDLPELKSTAFVSQPSLDLDPEYFSKYSSFFKLIDVLSWIRCFISNCRFSSELRDFNPFLTVTEINDTMIMLFRNHQEKYFRQEYTTLKAGNSLSSSSCLYDLLPVMDDNNLLPIGGRLENSKFPFSQRHPVILHGKDPIVKLLLLSLHLRYLHAGPTLLMSIVSREYYVVSARRFIRSISRNCVTCQRTYAKTKNQIMANLPASRVTLAAPFSHVGIDLAGPVFVRRGHTRKPIFDKAYIGVFVCLSTKAVHLELISDLSTAAFLAAFRRFAARQGYPSEVHSDNGTNFVGANNELHELYRLLAMKDSKQQIAEYYTGHQIKWSHIPGRSPHFGGLWEATVKAAKSLLQKLLRTQRLTWEEHYSILTDVEATLNSRPLCPLETMPTDGIEVLTPGHFLIGRPLIAPPAKLLSNSSISTLKRWNLCQKISSEL